ncbi:MAG: hypothetical protein IKC37_06045, partial [Clostridia bacterium]|nr:hypothetical protein [Clostridia bacterium]
MFPPNGKVSANIKEAQYFDTALLWCIMQNAERIIWAIFYPSIAQSLSNNFSIFFFAIISTTCPAIEKSSKTTENKIIWEVAKQIILTTAATAPT